MTPIPSSSYAKVLIYFIALLPPSFMLVGIVPMIFFVFGMVMATRTRDSGHIETANRNIIIYILLILLVCIGLLVYLLWDNRDNGYSRWEIEEIAPVAIIGCIAIAYGVLTRYFFGGALAPYWQWIEENGLFASKKTAAAKRLPADVEIIKSEKFRQYSVADELLKWSKLHEDGHVGKDEFDQIKGQLLGKPL